MDRSIVVQPKAANILLEDIGVSLVPYWVVLLKGDTSV